MMKPSISKLLETAVRHHQAEQLADAKKLYLEVLNLDPAQADALNLLGVIAHHEGDIDKALSLFDKAIDSAPTLPNVHYNKANALRDAGKVHDAYLSYSNALAHDPQHKDALLNISLMLQKNNQPRKAIEFLSKYIGNYPGDIKAHINMSLCYARIGNPAGAVEALSKALHLQPQDPTINFQLANAYSDIWQFDQAINYAKKALDYKPDWPQAHSFLGIALARDGQFKDSIEHCEKAKNLDPDNPAYSVVLGFVYQAAGDHDAAATHLLEATKQDRISPDSFNSLAAIAHEDSGPWPALKLLEYSMTVKTSTAALNNIGVMLQDLGLHALSLPFYEKAIKLDPNYIKSAIAIAHIHLLFGQFEKGWSELAAQLMDTTSIEQRENDLKFWQGEDLTEKTILIFFTAGLGEHILQSALISELIPQAGRVIVKCSSRMVPVFKRSFPSVDVISGEDVKRLSEAVLNSDFQFPALHIGKIYRRSFDDFPKRTEGYLKANRKLVAVLREKYLKHAEGKKIVGVAWHSLNSQIGDFKAIPIEALKPILETDKIFFVSLQYGNVTDQLNEFSSLTNIQIYNDDTVDQLIDMDSFFAQVAAMDLVITISNTTAHVAGALGVPTWVMLPRQGLGPLWFWFLERTNSPWYDSVRLFRQQNVGSQTSHWWHSVIEKVVKSLKAWIAGTPSATHPKP
ncbi:MAG: tetratricopeptide repeat protein [Rhodospirillaceae bacterium]